MERIKLHCKLEGVNENIVIGKIVKLNNIAHVLHIGNERYGLYAGWYSIIEKLNIHDKIEIEVD